MACGLYRPLPVPGRTPRTGETQHDRPGLAQTLKSVTGAADSEPSGMAETLYSVDDLLEQMVARNASDLHVTVGAHPVVRVRGKLEPLQEIPPLTPAVRPQLLYRSSSTEEQKHLELERQSDLAHSVRGLARFRVNVYWHREALRAAFRPA